MVGAVAKAVITGAKVVVKGAKAVSKGTKAVSAAAKASKAGKAAGAVGNAAKTGAKKVMFAEQAAEQMSPLDRAFQRVTGIAEEGADGALKYKKLTGIGLAAFGTAEASVTTGKALFGSGAENSRGRVSVADGMDRFVSYDGSGFTKNINSVAGGDTTVMNDIVAHTFPYQKGDIMLSDNNLGDIVFALHNNREG